MVDRVTSQMGGRHNVRSCAEPHTLLGYGIRQGAAIESILPQTRTATKNGQILGITFGGAKTTYKFRQKNETQGARKNFTYIQHLLLALAWPCGYFKNKAGAHVLQGGIFTTTMHVKTKLYRIH